MRAICDDLFDLFVLALQLPGRPELFRSLLRRCIRGRTGHPENVLTPAELASITMPLPSSWGDNDIFLSAAAARASVEKIPTAQFEVDSGGHDPWLDSAELCAKLITTWSGWTGACS